MVAGLLLQRRWQARSGNKGRPHPLASSADLQLAVTETVGLYRRRYFVYLLAGHYR